MIIGTRSCGCETRAVATARQEWRKNQTVAGMHESNCSISSSSGGGGGSSRRRRSEVRGCVCARVWRMGGKAVCMWMPDADADADADGITGWRFGGEGNVNEPGRADGQWQQCWRCLKMQDAVIYGVGTTGTGIDRPGVWARVPTGSSLRRLGMSPDTGSVVCAGLGAAWLSR
jgi:hypothetical protein